MLKEKKGVKKFISLCLALVLIVGVLPSAMKEVEASEATCEDCEKVYDNGFCDCGYQVAVDSDSDGYYEIGNAGQLYWFMNQWSAGQANMNAVLVDDIVVNVGDVAGCEGVKLEGWIDWNPMSTKTYKGTFDGDNHTISGLYYYSESQNDVGLFGQVDGGVVKNVGIINSYLSAAQRVGAVAGQTKNDATITNCYSDSTIKGVKIVGGISGRNEKATISECYNIGTVIGGASGMVGGICGYANSCTISKSYNRGTVYSDGNNAGGVCGQSEGSKIEYCFNIGKIDSTKTIVGGICGFSRNSSVIQYCYNAGVASGTGNVDAICGKNGASVSDCYYDSEKTPVGSSSAYTNIVAAETSAFTSGEVTYLMNTALGTNVWFQNLDNGSTVDAYPMLKGGTVYKNQIGGCTDASYVYGYSNTQQEAVVTHTYAYAATGNVITETCSNADCTHSATATLNVDTSIDTTYTGSAFEPLYVTYSDTWAGSKDLSVAYQNNTNASNEAYGTITYEGATAKQTFEIKIATDTLAITNDISKTYDGDAVADVTYTKNGTGTVTVEYKEQGASDDTYTTTKPVDAGEYVVRVSVASDGNYYAISATKDFEIAQRELTAVVTVKDKNYDGNATAEIDNVQFDDVVDGDTVNLVGGAATISQATVGNGLVVSFAGYSVDNDNYILVAQPVDAAINIAQKEITAVITVNNKVYDGNDVAEVKEIKLVGVVDGDTVNAVNGTAKFADKNAGNNKTVVFENWVLDNANYKLAAQPANTTANIEQRTLVATVTVADKTYDASTTATVNGYTFDNVVSGETVALINGTANFTDKNAGNNKTVVFANWELDNANYKLAAQPANATANISQKAIIATVTIADKTYDGTNIAEVESYGFDDVYGSDSVTLINGTATFDNANVGNNKVVTFASFTIDNANYILAAQPANATANILQEDLYIEVVVSDKQYDGLNTATIASASLKGLVPSDNGAIQLTNGVATFNSVRVADGIAISFTEFTISGANAGNYNLIQPTGIVANIYNNFIADSSNYEVTSNDWINRDFVIRAKEGYAVSLTDTAEGAWEQELRYTDETANGSVTFYVKDNSYGFISIAVTETYKIDKTAPETFDIVFNENSVKKFINEITFGLFYNKNIDVVITAEDALSGVDEVYYYLTDTILTEDEVVAISDWTEYNSFALEAADEATAVVYVKVIDNAGNITCFASNGATFDLTAPVIEGVEDGATYYVSQMIEITDTNYESLVIAQGDVMATANADDTDVLAGNVEMVYTITATDKAGNETVYTVYMKTIASILEPIAEITTDNVTSADLGAIVEVTDILASLDLEDATDEELDEIEAAALNCGTLAEKILEVALTIEELTTAASEITSENVVLENKDALVEAKEALEESIEADAGNLTDEEIAAMEEEVARIDALLTTIANAQAVIDEISKLPAKDKITLNDETAIAAARKNYDALTEYEKTLVDDSAITAAEKQLETLKKESPKTYDTAVTSTWMVLLLISAMVILTAVYFERKRNR